MEIKTFDQIRAMVDAVAMKKKARESNTPKDPFEVGEVSAKATENVIDNKEVNVPEGKDNGKAVEKETSSVPTKSGDEAAAVKPAVEEQCKVTEECVAKCGSEILKKIQGDLTQKVEAKPAEPVANKKAAEVKENVAANINLSVDALAKIASEIMNTEEGAKFAKDLFRKKAGEEYAAAAIKEASEQVKLYKEYEEKMKSNQANPVAKFASEVAKLPADVQKEVERRLEAHSCNMKEYEHDILKRAYAAGAEDAQAVMDNPEVMALADQAVPAEEGQLDITPDEIMQAIAEMVEANEIDEETANKLIELIMGGEGQPAEVAPETAPAATPSDEELAAAASAAEAAPEVINPAAKLASEIVQGTILLKKASVEQGIVEDDGQDASLEDVINVITQLQAEGSLSEEAAQAVLQEIAMAMQDEEAAPETAPVIKEEVAVEETDAPKEGESKKEKPEKEKKEDDDDDDDDDEAIAAEEVEKVASVLKL